MWWGTIQKSSPNILVTKVSTDATSIKYFGGKRSSDAGINQGGGQMYFSGTQNPQQYYNPQGGTLPANQGSPCTNRETRESPYYQINRTYDSRLNPKEDKSCSISHLIYINAAGDLVLSTNDTCAGLDLNGCVLNQEELCDYENKNCVMSVADGNATGLSPIYPPTPITDAEARTFLFGFNGWHYYLL